MKQIKSIGYKFTNSKTKEIFYVPDWIGDKLQDTMKEERKKAQNELIDKMIKTKIYSVGGIYLDTEYRIYKNKLDSYNETYTNLGDKNGN